MIVSNGCKNKYQLSQNCLNNVKNIIDNGVNNKIRTSEQQEEALNTISIDITTNNNMQIMINEYCYSEESEEDEPISITESEGSYGYTSESDEEYFKNQREMVISRLSEYLYGDVFYYYKNEY
jgi:hypothetical protein